MFRELTALSGFARLGLLCAAFAAGVLSAASARAADPAVNECLAASESSLKFGNEHQRIEERAELLKCAADVCPGVIREECARRLQDVNRIIPTLVLDVRDASNQRVAAKVQIDGQPVADAVVDRPLAVNPGQHRLVIEAANYPSVAREVVVSEGEVDRTVSIQLAPGKSSEAPESAPTLVWSTRRSTQGAFALTSAGVAIVGLGVGSAFGVVALSKKRHAREVCPDRCADDAGVETWAEAKRAGNVSTVAFAVGGVAAIAALGLWITLPKSDAHVEVGWSSVSVGGSF